ncbi:MAG: TonB-dependent receptor [Pseudoxanthomonas sp.]
MAVNRTKLAMQRTALSVALGMCFSTVAFAQSNTSGSITGQAAAGSTVQITNPATGFARSTTVSSEGNYRFSALSTGEYTVTFSGSDGTASTREGVRVNVGTATTVNFTAGSSSASTLDTVTVRGISQALNPIDVSSVESTTILTAEQINRIPVSRDLTSVALLAPGTVRGDSAFGNLASFGGSSVAENQYYVNGFNITNSFQSLNFSNVPFEAVAEQQIKTGGYGAEFGRSLGGVVNQITKRGSNEFHAGANAYYTPSSLSAHTRNTYYQNPLTGEYGTLRSDNQKDEDESWVTAAWASGALVKDTLFAYGLVQYNRTMTDTYGSVLANSNTKSRQGKPSWLLKMDWNINDSNKLEFTSFSDQATVKQVSYSNDRGELERNAKTGTFFSETGGDNYILKYTGYLTDSFTLSALAGHGEYSRSSYLRAPDGSKISYSGDIDTPATGCPFVTDSRPLARRQATGIYQSNCNINLGGLIDAENSGDERDQYRLDAEWVLGEHLIRFGYDRDDYESIAGDGQEGGRAYTYFTSAGRDYVREQITATGADVKVKQEAFYIEDNWHVTENLLAYIGLRWDSFENQNGDGATYVEIKNQFGPRLGFSWDVNGDSTTKIYGNAGRYALPLTPSVAIRGASASLYQRHEFYYTAVDPATGIPTGLTERNPIQYINGEFGSPKDPKTIASKNLDPMYQDEYILGFQQELTEHLKFGVKGTYRKLKAAIDDNCDYTAITELADAEGKDYILPNGGFPYCRMFNPGEDAVFVTDLLGDGNYTEYTIPGDRLTPKAKRTYKALEFNLDGSYEKLFFNANYTLAYSKGNTEGGVKSDIGQSDTSVTQDFDYKELTVDTYGYLPNDRRHTFKFFGNYQFSDEWSVGANLVIQSGRPKNCLGTLDLNPALPVYNADGTVQTSNFTAHPYGSSFMRCGTTVNGGIDDSTVVAVPRGKAGRLPWSRTLDLNVAYRPAFADGWQFKVDIFNVLNSQEVTAINETAELSSGLPSSTYLLPDSYQPPRSFRFMAQYDF